MADIILHESVLALGTEGYFFGDDELDVRYPHWPGYQSGVSIGVGFDIGASGITAKELQTVMSTLGVPDKMIAELAKTINIKGTAAGELLKQLGLRKKVRLTQQQALDIMLVIKQNTGKYVKRGFSQSYAIDNQTSNESVLDNIKNALKGTGSISASVGDGGKNSKADVLVVRALLTNAGYHDKAIWKDIKVQIKTLSVVDNTLIQNIKQFQKEKVFSSNPDGRIDVGGGTLNVLNGANVTPQNNSNNEVEKPVANKSLTASVGTAGVNNKADVLLVQQLLNKQGEKLVEDGAIGSKTTAAITRFQQTTFGRSDGLVSPNKETWNALSKGGNNSTPTEEEIVVTPTSMDAAVFPYF